MKEVEVERDESLPHSVLALDLTFLGLDWSLSWRSRSCFVSGKIQSSELRSCRELRTPLRSFSFDKSEQKNGLEHFHRQRGKLEQLHTY